MKYTFEEFCDHLEALDKVRDYEYVTTPGAGTLHLDIESRSFEKSALQVSEYMRDIYKDKKEALWKTTIFTSILNFAAHHLDELEKEDLAVNGRENSLLKDSAWKAIHRAHCESFFERKWDIVPIDAVINYAKEFEQDGGEEC